MVATFLKDCFRFYGQNFRYFIAILLPIIIPLQIGDFLIQQFWVTDPTSMTQQLPSLMLSLTVYPIYQGALILGISQLLAGQSPAVSDLWKQGMGFWFGILAVNAIFFTAVFIGTLLLIIPGIYLAVRLVLAEQNVVLNMENPIDAIKSSWEDTSDQFWNIFLGSLLLGALAILITTPLTLLVSNTGALSNVLIVIPSLVQTMLYPLFVIYYLRIRHYVQHNE